MFTLCKDIDTGRKFRIRLPTPTSSIRFGTHAPGGMHIIHCGVVPI